MKTRFCIGLPVVLILLGGLAGCGGGSSQTSSSSIRDAVGRVVGPVASLSGFTITISTDKTTYRTGDTINMTVSATNNNANSRTITYGSGSDLLKWGYIITTAADDKIVTYEYWAGHKEFFVTNVGTDIYATGETKTFSYTFPYPLVSDGYDSVRMLSPGTYKVYAKMPDSANYLGTKISYSTPTPASQPVTITITN